MSSPDTLLLPGQPIPASLSSRPQQTGETSAAGRQGSYLRGAHVLSSIVGYPQPIAKKKDSGTSDAASTQSAPLANARFVVPSPAATVLGRVTRVTPRQANVSILVVDGYPCSMGDRSAASETNHAAGEDPMGGDFTGIIRSQDVRATEKDKIRMGDCFRPGDIVRASVISLGDARSYFLSTASNHLGVVYALPSPGSHSLTGNRGNEESLVPINWQEMQCPRTGVFERRKVAKPDTAAR